MKDFDWYAGKDIDRNNFFSGFSGEKPRKPVFLEKHNTTIAALDEFREKLLEYEEAMAEWEPAQKAYQTAINARSLRFGVDLYEEYFDPSWMTQQTWDKIYDKAWDSGHSGGYGEVALHLEELIDFLDDIRKTFVK